MRVEAQPAYVLHARAYRETSLLLECLSLEHGRVGLVARGVRRERSRFSRAILQPLQPLRLSWMGNGELFALTLAEAVGAAHAVSAQRLVSAMYVNELVLRLSARADPHSGLFEHYVACLDGLATGESEAWTLRRFERDLLADLGYGLVLEQDIESGRRVDAESSYAYVMDAGPRPWRGQADGLMIPGVALLALARDEMPDAECARILRLLMRQLLQNQLGGGLLRAWSMQPPAGGQNC